MLPSNIEMYVKVLRSQWVLVLSKGNAVLYIAAFSCMIQPHPLLLPTLSRTHRGLLFTQPSCSRAFPVHHVCLLCLLVIKAYYIQYIKYIEPIIIYSRLLEYYICPIYNIGLLLYIIHRHCTISFCTVQKHCKLTNIWGFKFIYVDAKLE